MTALNDDQYFRWVYLHPQYSVREKNKYTNQRKNEIKVRKQEEKAQSKFEATKDLVSSLMSSASNAASNVVTHARRASSSKPIVNASKVTVQRRGKSGAGKPPKITAVASASNLKRTTSEKTFTSWA